MGHISGTIEETGQETTRAGKNSRHSRKYTIFADTSAAAASSLIGARPASVIVEGYTLADVVEKLNETDEGVWAGSVSWSHAEASRKDQNDDSLLLPDNESIDFDFSGGSQKITEAFAQTSYNNGAGTAPNVGLSIGVTSNGVEGVEIVVPQGTIGKTRVYTAATVTESWIKTRAAMIGKVNSDPYLSCAAGELLFIAFSGRKRGSGNWEVSYRFAYSENKTWNPSDTDIPGKIVLASAMTKQGHDYLWVFYEDSLDATAKKIIQKARSVHVAQVYKRAAYAGLI